MATTRNDVEEAHNTSAFNALALTRIHDEVRWIDNGIVLRISGEEEAVRKLGPLPQRYGQATAALRA